MRDSLITIRNIEGTLLTSRVVRSAANLEYHSERALEHTSEAFQVDPSQLSLSVQDDWDRYSRVQIAS